MKLSQLVDEIRAEYPDADDAKIANLVIDAALASDDPANLLFPAVHGYVITLERGRVRDNERKSAPFKDRPQPGKPSRGKTASANDEAARQKEYVKPGSSEDPAIAARRALLRDKVRVPEKGYVAWGELTVEDHEARIAFLRQRIAGHQATIDRHAEAVAVLRQAGCQTLNEYYQ